MLPTSQRCPICGKQFLGSDAIGQPCLECAATCPDCGDWGTTITGNYHQGPRSEPCPRCEREKKRKKNRMRLYLASSWRNVHQPEYVELLRAAGHDVYDFRGPDAGFSWADVDPRWQAWTTKEFRAGLEHPRAARGFAMDFAGMSIADGCVLLLPCGRSAHLEAGWFVGARRPLWVVMPEQSAPLEPELMYRFARKVCVCSSELLEAIEQEEAKLAKGANDA